MGAQDTKDEADDFKADGGVETPTMIWDPSFDSWIHYGVRGQPAAILVDANGNELGRWLGAFDLDEVLDTLP